MRHMMVRSRPRDVTSLLLKPVSSQLLQEETSPRSLLDWFSRPESVPQSASLNLHFDPLGTLMNLANFATAGMTENILGLSRSSLEELHVIGVAIRFMMAMDDMSWLWRTVPDWTQVNALPKWVVPGEVDFDASL